MKRGVFLIACSLIAGTLAGCATTGAERAGAEPGRTPVTERARVPDEYIVTLSPAVDRSVIEEDFGRFGIKDIYPLEEETYLLVLTNDPGPQQLEDVIYDDERIRSVHPNLVYWANRAGKAN